MTDSIYDILDRFNAVNEELAPQQKAVKQLPALFRPKNTSPQLGGKYPGDNATRGYLVGEDQETTEGEVVAINRAGFNVLRNKEDYLEKRDVIFRLLSRPGLDPETKDAAKTRLADLERAARNAGIVQEETDQQEYNKIAAELNAARQANDMARVKELTQQLMDLRPDGVEIDIKGQVKPMSESATTEDVLSTMKKKLGDYLQDVASAIKKDPDLMDKVDQAVDQVGPAVKTITTDDGREIKIHGNEDDGFRISIRNKPIKSKFDNLDEAVMACEMYCSRRRAVSETNLDYVEEKR